MRRNDPLSLGIEISEREIRIVQTGTKAGRPTVTQAVALPIPPGALMGGVPLEPGTLVIGLRKALDAIGIPAAASAAVAVSGEQSIFRTVTVPPCPESELPALVASEVDHERAFGPGDAYGYFPIFPADAATGTMQNLVVVGADASVTRSLVEVVEGAGIVVEALEPAPLALLRTATVGLAPGASTFVLVVGTGHTDAAFFADGRLVALRRLDVGLDSLVQTQALTPWDESPDEGFAVEGSRPPESLSHLDGEAVDRLAVEAQRTVDYVQRASRGATAIDRMRIVGDDPQIEPLAAMLERRLGLGVEVARAPAALGGAPDVRFSAAYGLAIRAVEAGVGTPAIDLFTADRTAARRVETKRYFMGSVLVAALSVAVGLGGCLLYNGQIAASRRRCADVQAETAKARQTAETAIASRSDEALRDKTLRKEGVPLGVLMDYVSSGLDSGVGLKLVTVGDDLAVRLQGEARDETALVRTAQALKASPVLLNVAVDRFDRDDKALGLIKFELSGQTVTADRLNQEAPKG